MTTPADHVQPWARQRRSRLATLVGIALVLSSCRSDSNRVTVAETVASTPILTAVAGSEQLPGPPPSEPGEVAKEIDELLSLQSARTTAAEEEVAYWQAGAVLRWNEIARGLVMKYRTSPPNASRVYALVSVAQHDALALAAEHHRRYNRTPPSVMDERVQPVLGAELTATYPSDHAAVATASALVLAHLYSSRAEVAALERRSAEHKGSRLKGGLSLRSDIEAGERIGRAVAARVIDRAKDDGSKRQIPWPGEIPRGPDKWFSSESPAVEPLRPRWGFVKPWLLERGDQLRPPPPPELGSTEFNEALDEVRRYSQMRKPEQLRIAKLWADGPGTSTPPGHWNEIAADLIRQRRLDEIEAARVMAYLNMALMDAGIACWDAKYSYWLIRPSQVDPTIGLPVGLPNFPAYPSGHSTFSAAAAEILGLFFPEDQERLRLMAEEASMSRIYGGIHYRFDAKEGLRLGQAIGRLAAQREEEQRREQERRLSASR